jgi:hypothetical protein
MEAVPPQRAPLKRPLPSRRYSRPLHVEAHCAAWTRATNRKRSHARGCPGKKKEKKEKRKKGKEKKERKYKKMNYLFFRNCDLQFILTILLLNNKNKI